MWRPPQFYTAYARIYERQSLLNRPWEEDFLHFARDGSVHGHLISPTDGRRRRVTSDGWCPADEAPHLSGTGCESHAVVNPLAGHVG